MAAKKITPAEARALYKSAKVNGVTYGYLDSPPPAGTPIVNTVLLVHGFPDFSFGWRYQISHLNSLGLRCIVPDMLGYGRTDAPEDPARYTFKNIAADLAALVNHLGLSRIFLGGHDWGGSTVYRLAQRYPDLFSAVFVICTPFYPVAPPGGNFHDASELPNFKYQIQFRSELLVNELVGKEKLRQFINGMYGGKGPNGEVAMDVSTGVILENLASLGPAPLLTPEEVDHYAESYAIHGMRGPTNWYRTGRLNYEEEQKDLALVENFQFSIPTLFITGFRDSALPPRLSVGMERHFKDLTRGEVNTGHWAMSEKPTEVNNLIEEFLVSKVGLGKPRL